MGSFYGNTGISARDADERIEAGVTESKNHIIISTTQPTVQKAGDIWLVTVSTEDDDG